MQKKKNAQTSSTFYHGLLFFHCEAKMLFSHASIESADAREEKKEIYVCQRQYSGRHYFARSCLRESFSSFFFFLKGFTILSAAATQAKASSRAHKKKKKDKIKKKKKKKRNPQVINKCTQNNKKKRRNDVRRASIRKPRREHCRPT